MALQIWLPLNGNLTNNGIYSTTVTNHGTTSANGLLGQCYRFNGSSQWITIRQPSLDSDFSICCWIYLSSTSQQCIYTSRTATGEGVAVFIMNSGKTIRFDTGAGALTSFSCTLSTNTWTHICATRSASGKKLYINGQLVSESTAAGTFSTIGTYGTIGGSETSDNGTATENWLNGYLNDFRIYDECLSYEQIRQISQGLILHYPLDQSEKSRNLLPNTRAFTASTTSASTLTGEYYMGYAIRYLDTSSLETSSYKEFCYWGSSIVPSVNAVFTWSFYAKGTEKVRCHFYSGSVSVSKCESSQGITTTASDGNIDITLSSDWKRYWVRYTLASTSTSETVSNKHVLFRQFGGNKVYICGVKFETGDEAHDWSPAWEDAESWFDGMEYDCSGYGYHGAVTETTTPSYVSDSPVNHGSYHFTSNASTLQVGSFLSMNQTRYNLTVSIWFKTNTLNSTTPNLFSLGENSFIRVRLASATSIWCYYRCNATMCSESVSTKTLTDNQWHMFAFTFKYGGTVSYYLDGVLLQTADRSGTGAYLTCSANASANWHLAGYLANSENFIGYLSDFRVYGTALSAEDIKNLYCAKMKVDPSGNVFCYGILENESVFVSKNGVITCKNWTEKDSSDTDKNGGTMIEI